MSMTSESDERMITNNSVDSPSMDDEISGGNVGSNGPLKKGPWTSAEDAILVAYVTKHGEGNWNAVQKHSGLARCGKSCRLRWANHLRPDLKKGAFTPEEERRIIELHAKMGNKWARMAAELPGRTDNEIKNFWNTRIKRRQRAGLPLYPPDICLQSPDLNQLNDDNMNTFSSGPHPDFMPVNNNMQIPPVEFIEFKGLEFSHQIHPQVLIDMPAGASLLDIPTGFNSSYHNKPVFSTLHPSKRLRGSELLFPSLIGSHYPSDGLMQIAKSSEFSDYSTTPSSLIPDGHIILNGNHSSGPGWGTKIELPSLQTQMGNGGSGPSGSSPLPYFESVDILIQTPPTENTQNSGLLEEVLYESETMKNSNANVFSHGSNIENNIMENNSARVFNETKWEGGYDEQLSPFGHSTTSVFSESNPITPISGNSLDEPRLAESLPVKEEASNLVPTQYHDKDEKTNQMIFSRPDYLLASNCIVPLNNPTNDHSLLENAMGKLLGDDLSRDCKQMDTGSSSSAQGRGRNSCAWNAMPTV